MATSLPPGLDLTESKVPKLQGTIISTWLLSVLVVALRFQSRWLSKVKPWWDDWTVLFALILGSVANIIPFVWMIPDGFGKHIYVAPSDSVTQFFKALFAGEMTICSTFAASQISVLLLYCRIFNQTHYVIIASYIVGSMIALWSIGFILAIALQCIPIRAFWDRSMVGVCGVDAKRFFLGRAIPHTSIDIAALCIPIRPVWKLHVSTKYKISVILMFLIGGLTVAVSIARLVYLLEVNLTSVDITWNFVDFLILTCLEANFGIISACLPCLQPAMLFYFSHATSLIHRLFPRKIKKGPQQAWCSLPDPHPSFQPYPAGSDRENTIWIIETALDTGLHPPPKLGANEIRMDTSFSINSNDV